MKFSKPAKSAEELVDLYKARGVIIDNDEEAQNAFEYIGHYRLSGYARFFQTDLKNHTFKEGTKFSEILQLYQFDQDLRFLLSNYLAKIEIGVRKVISSYMYRTYEPHWFMEPAHFKKAEFQPIIQEEIIKSTGKADKLGKLKLQKREVFFDHYYSTYSDPALPPSWMIEEALTFGKWSLIYSNLKRSDRKKIAHKFGFAAEIFESWIHSLVYLRNLCVHHGRLWNRRFRVPPKIPMEHNKKIKTNDNLYYYIVVMEGFLKDIEPNSQLKQEIATLFDKYPAINKAHIGFEEKWGDSSLWEEGLKEKAA